MKCIVPATMIAMTFVMVSPWSWLGFIFLVVSALLAVVRVVSGVHYMSDVIAGIAVALIAAGIGYMWL